MDAARHRATYEDLANLPPHMVGEILDGDLFTTPRPGSAHALAASAIGAELFGRFNRPPDGPGAPGGWWILFEPELHLGADVVVPDLAGWRRDTMPILPQVAAFDQAPDWTCEVVSPNTASLDRVRKMRIYAREAVAHLWLVDPATRTLEAYHLERDRWVVASTHAGRDPIQAEPFSPRRSRPLPLVDGNAVSPLTAPGCVA